MTEERGKALSADLERFILLVEFSGGSGSGGEVVNALLISPAYLLIKIKQHLKVDNYAVYKNMDKTKR